MRIAIAGFYHETNAFGSVPVTLDVLMQNCFERQAFLDHCSKIRSYHGGVIDEAAAQGVELVPTVFYTLLPSGPLTPDALEKVRSRMVELLVEANNEKPLDAIALPMHGAGGTPECPDIEGMLLRNIRQALGRDIPIGVCLDLHGNLSEEMAELSDILIGVRQYPHVDEYDTGREMMTMLCNLVRTGQRYYKRLIKLPWLMASAEGLTTSGPAGDVHRYCMTQESADPELLRASFFHGFPYSDVPMASVSIITNALTQEAADRNAADIAAYAWNRRQDFPVPIYSAKQAVDLALACEEGPVLINESSDNPGGGSPADGTHLLRELIERNVPSAFGFIYDPETAAQAAAAGVGAHISCRLGGKTDDLHGKPIEIADAYVRSISDGNFIRRPPISAGKLTQLGITVCLVVGNVSIVVAGCRTQTFDDGPFRLVGIDWQTQQILALKSSIHFKAWWTDKVKAIIPCESPGVHSADLRTIPLTRANTSFYPLGNPEWNA